MTVPDQADERCEAAVSPLQSVFEAIDDLRPIDPAVLAALRERHARHGGETHRPIKLLE